MKLWVESCNKLRELLPREVDDALEKHERDGTYDDPEYEKAVDFFYKRHLCMVASQDCEDSLNWIKEDDTVYYTM